MCIKPPNAKPPKKPRAHKTINTIAIVVSILIKTKHPAINYRVFRF